MAALSNQPGGAISANVTGVCAVGRLRSVLPRSKWPMERNDTGKYLRLQLLFLVLILVTETK